MLWAIDVGNTQTVVGIHDGSGWVAEWRLTTDRDRTEDELAAHLTALANFRRLEWRASTVVLGSVVPPVDVVWKRFAEDYLHCPLVQLKDGGSVGLEMDYDPPHAVGADRIANALGALELYSAPLIVVDFGTATTLDCVDSQGRYAGGSILPGVTVSLESLVGRTAKLPAISLEAPKRAVGKTTVESLQSGVVLGYAGAVDAVVRRASAELGEGCTVVSTGGLGTVFQPLCETISEHLPLLTLDGLRIAAERLGKSSNFD